MPNDHSTAGRHAPSPSSRPLRVLGVETSCDETGVAIYDVEGGLLAQRLHSQVAVHAEYGGVVPELASRDHVRRLIPLIRETLAESGTPPSRVDGIAYTAGPGLAGALLVGGAVARSLAFAWGVPAVGVHHLEGHLLSPLLETPAPDFPFLALLVSGGHTQLMSVAGVGGYRLLGETLDDAAGEAFDKVASLLGLAYPGGPALAALAERGDPARFRFPRPMTDRPGLDFSFSGLKTFAYNTLANHTMDEILKADVARAFEDAVVDTMVIKCRRALRESGQSRLVVAGGVGANRRLRAALVTMAEKEGASVSYPRPELCTDNGAMIAFAGCQRLRAGAAEPLAFAARPRWRLDELPRIDAGALRLPGSGFLPDPALGA